MVFARVILKRFITGPNCIVEFLGHSVSIAVMAIFLNEEVPCHTLMKKSSGKSIEVQLKYPVHRW